MQSEIFYQHHLEEVSRSFSFCIKELLSPLKEWVALAYLLCRIADTIEDAAWIKQTDQTEAFQQFKSFLYEAPKKPSFLQWFDGFPKTLIAAERDLLADLPSLLADLGQLPLPIQQHIKKTLLQMIGGMTHFIEHHKKNQRLLINALPEMNQYCFFVAGIVGKLLSLIVAYDNKTWVITDALLNQSFHFGLFLQKINLLKDQAKDRAEGRFFSVAYETIYDSLLLNAHHAMIYLKAIPISSGRPYRLFCAWSLFIGLATLKWIDKNRLTNLPAKLSNKETSHLTYRVRQIIDDNQALETLFNVYLAALNAQKPLNFSTFTTQESEKKGLPTWFVNAYQEDVSMIQVQTLEIIV